MRTVRQLLGSKTPEVYAVSPDASVLDAIRLMAEKGVGAVLAMQGPHLCGIVSERDYARKVVLQGRSSSNTPVRDIISAVAPDSSATVNASFRAVGGSLTPATVTVTVAVASLPGVPSLMV